MNGIWLARRLLVSWKRGEKASWRGLTRGPWLQRSLGVPEEACAGGLRPGGPAHLAPESRVKARGDSVWAAQFQRPGTYSLWH